MKPSQAGRHGDSCVMSHQPVLGVSDFPSLLIQNLRSHLVLQEDTSAAQINSFFKTHLPVPGAMCRGHRVLTICVLLELGKLSGAERDPPTITHLPVVGHEPLCSLCRA